MVIKLLDYKSDEVLVDVGDIETIESMIIEVITGDEILTVTYKDGTVHEYDSSDCRVMNFRDACYVIYNEKKGINKIDNEKFMNRTTSYWFDED